MHPNVIPARVLEYLTEKNPDWVHVIYDGWLVYRDINEEGLETQRLVCRVHHLKDFHTRKLVAFSKEADTW